MDRATHKSADTNADIQSRFAPVFALKSAVLVEKTLNAAEQRRAWDALISAVPEILARCSGISTHPDNEDFPLPLVLWDFLNGREICISVNKQGGYNLSVRADEIRWMETQLPLDLLLLKLLALDYTPEEFRGMTG